MCIAIAKTSGSTISAEVLRNSFESNPDGAGFAFTRNGRLVVRKGFFTANELIAAYRAEVSRDDVAIVHCRLASHGIIATSNCHPFLVSDEWAVIHNGVLPWRSTRLISDTRMFVGDYLTPNSSRIDTSEFCDETAELIGQFNKLVFLSFDGRIRIINESAGHWDKGCWFSNLSYQNSSRSKTPQRRSYARQRKQRKQTEEENLFSEFGF